MNPFTPKKLWVGEGRQKREWKQLHIIVVGAPPPRPPRRGRYSLGPKKYRTRCGSKFPTQAPPAPPSSRTSPPPPTYAAPAPPSGNLISVHFCCLIGSVSSYPCASLNSSLAVCRYSLCSCKAQWLSSPIFLFVSVLVVYFFPV